jgi:hypothetical protein
MGRLLDMFAEAGLVVNDLRGELPTSERVGWSYRELQVVRYLFVHHSAGSVTYSAAGIANLHIKFGWPGIAYTFYVRPGAEIDFCHRLRDWGPQAGGRWNEVSCGLCFAGNWVRERPPAEMVEAAVGVATVLNDFYLEETGHGLVLRPHRAVSRTKCPGLAWEAFAEAMWGDWDVYAV